jgi:hypothetical protein
MSCLSIAAVVSFPKFEMVREARSTPAVWLESGINHETICQLMSATEEMLGN